MMDKITGCLYCFFSSSIFIYYSYLQSSIFVLCYLNCLNLPGNRDVPFSAICWSILEHTRRSIFSLKGEESRAGSIIGANFTAGFVAGAVAAAATCPLDVAKTRR